MKRILIAGTLALAAGGQALAADLPQPAPPPPRAPAFTWTGIYIGINGGFAFGDSSFTDPINGSTGSVSTTGFLAGGTIGGNYQWGQFVLGIEGDGDWTNLTGTTTTTAGYCVGCTTQSDWLATVRGRAGYAFDRILVYGTGGAAFGNLQAAAGALPFSSSTQTGWTAGGGVEVALSPNWTAKVEYLYVNLGSQSCPVGSCSTSGNPTTVPLTENVVRAGLNYKFW